MRNITAQELKQLLDSDDEAPLILDVREAWEIERAHLPNSYFIPMRDLPQRLSELDPDRTTVVLCHHGIRSRTAALYMEREFQFSRVFNLSGGIDAWARDVDPNLPTY